MKLTSKIKVSKKLPVSKAVNFSKKKKAPKADPNKKYKDSYPAYA